MFLLLYFQLCDINGGPWKGPFWDLTMALKNHQQYGGNNASSQPILNENAKKIKKHLQLKKKSNSSLFEIYCSEIIHSLIDTFMGPYKLDCDRK